MTLDQPTRFVVLRHDPAASLERTSQPHLDWMFEVGGVLWTWATPVIESFDQSLELSAESLSDHRLAYLDFEGEIDGNRGTVTRVIAGTYGAACPQRDLFVADLRFDSGGSESRSTATFYRSLPGGVLRREESLPSWRLRFSPGRYETNR